MPAMPDLYVCHTAYQLLVDLLRAARKGGGHHLVLTTAVPDAEALRGRLLATGAFAGVTLVDEGKFPGMVQGPFAALRARRDFVRACGWQLHRAHYGEVYIHNDWSPLGRYLQDCNAGYILCEDTFASTLGPDQHLVYDQRKAPQGRYLYWGDSPACRAVETEDAARCTLFPPEKLVEDRKADLLASLTDAEKAMVRAVFLTQPLPEHAEGATLLLTRSFVADGLLDQPAQDRMFLAVARQYAAGPLFVKAHPRDTADYAALFPQAVVLQRTMPSEVLNFCLPFRFRRAVTVQSFALRGFTAADEKVTLTLEQALALPGAAPAAPQKGGQA